MFTVIKTFADLQDKGYIYHEGDIFPRDGLTVSSERIAELMGSDNKIGQPLIKDFKPLPESVTVVDNFEIAEDAPIEDLTEKKPAKKK